MNKSYLAILLAAGMTLAGCKSNEAKPEEKPAEPAPVATKAEPAPAPAPSKPECTPEQTAAMKKAATGKPKTTSKSKTVKKEEPAAPDCEPAKPKSTKEAPPKPAAESKPAPAPAAPPPAATAKETSAVGKACNPCVVKSKDGTFDGEVYGTIPAGSKWAQLRIGMEQPEVERLLGVSHQVHAYPTAKAWIPFYYGTDRTRYEVTYPGQGSVSYTGGSWGGGRGVLMMINYDPK